jgi:hypothetical protein
MDKKKKDKKKKTDPAPLHKEDKTIADSSSSSLSLAGKDKASVDSPPLSLASKVKASADSSSSLSLTGGDELSEVERREILGPKYSWSLTQKERLEKMAQVRRGNPGASEEEVKTLYRALILDEALKAQDLEVERRAAKRRQAREDEAQPEPAYALALDSMEKAIQENINAVYEEEADWVWAKEALLVTYSQTMTMNEGTAWRREIRKETRRPIHC